MHNNMYNILINNQSGTVMRLGEDYILDKIKSSHLPIKDVFFLGSEEFFSKLEELKKAENPLLIGGGDGTIRSCSEILHREGTPFGILPLGTMNLLAKDLGLSGRLDDDLLNYKNGHEIKNIDIAMVNNVPFICCVGIGAMPEASEYRETVRGKNEYFVFPKLTYFVLGKLGVEHHRKFKICINGKVKKVITSALVLSNNLFSSEVNLFETNVFKKNSLNSGLIGVYSASPENLYGRIRLLVSVCTGLWRKDPMVGCWRGETVSVHTDRSEELVSLDGETFTLKTPLNFWVNPKALSVIVPKDYLVDVEKQNAA